MPPPETRNPPPVAAGEGQKASDSGKRLNRYGKARAVTNALLDTISDQELIRAGISKPSNVRDCGNALWFRHYYTIDQHKLSGGYFCQKPLICGLCAILRGSKLLASYLARLKLVQVVEPRLRPVMVTLSVRNGHDLSERLDKLRHSMKLLHGRRHLKNQPSVMHGVAGGVFSVEVVNNGKGWHPHAHAIWMVDQDHEAFTDSRTWALQKLSPEWHAITGDSFIVDARPITPTDEENPYAAGFCEVFKYAVKPAELGRERLLEAFPILSGKRLVGAFGCFFGIKEPAKLTDDLDAFKGLPYFEYFYRFMHGGYHVAEEPVHHENHD